MRPRPKAPADWCVAENTHGFNHDARGIGLLDMAYAVRDGRAPRASGEMAFHVYEAMEGITASSQTGNFVDVQSRCARPDILPENFPQSED